MVYVPFMFRASNQYPNSQNSEPYDIHINRGSKIHNNMNTLHINQSTGGDIYHSMNRQSRVDYKESTMNENIHIKPDFSVVKTNSVIQRLNADEQTNTENRFNLSENDLNKRSLIQRNFDNILQNTPQYQPTKNNSSYRDQDDENSDSEKSHISSDLNLFGNHDDINYFGNNDHINHTQTRIKRIVSPPNFDTNGIREEISFDTPLNRNTKNIELGKITSTVDTRSKIITSEDLRKEEQKKEIVQPNMQSSSILAQSIGNIGKSNINTEFFPNQNNDRKSLYTKVNSNVSIPTEQQSSVFKPINTVNLEKNEYSKVDNLYIPTEQQSSVFKPINTVNLEKKKYSKVNNLYIPTEQQSSVFKPINTVNLEKKEYSKVNNLYIPTEQQSSVFKPINTGNPERKEYSKVNNLYIPTEQQPQKINLKKPTNATIKNYAKKTQQSNKDITQKTLVQKENKIPNLTIINQSNFEKSKKPITKIQTMYDPAEKNKVKKTQPENPKPKNKIPVVASAGAGLLLGVGAKKQNKSTNS